MWAMACAHEVRRRGQKGGQDLIAEIRRMRREEGNHSVLALLDPEPLPDHVCEVHPPACDDDNATVTELSSLASITSRVG